ncbi:hypothetical protein ACTXT7_014038 [Hymenolepis weldensis]
MSRCRSLGEKIDTCLDVSRLSSSMSRRNDWNLFRVAWVVLYYGVVASHLYLMQYLSESKSRLRYPSEEIRDDPLVIHDVV